METKVRAAHKLATELSTECDERLRPVAYGRVFDAMMAGTLANPLTGFIFDSQSFNQKDPGEAADKLRRFRLRVESLRETSGFQALTPSRIVELAEEVFGLQLTEPQA